MKCSNCSTLFSNVFIINKTSGSFDSPTIQALIGKAIAKKFLSFEYEPHSTLDQAHFALQIRPNDQIKQMNMDSKEVKAALQKKKESVVIKKGKQIEKK